MIRHWKKIVLILCVSVPLSSCTWLKDWWYGKPELNEVREIKGFESKEIRYDVEFKGDVNEKILEFLGKKSLLVQFADHPPISKMALLKRIRVDKYRLRMAMISKGYFDSTIKAVLTVEKSGKRLIRFTVYSNMRFKISRITIKSKDESDNLPDLMVTDHSVTMQIAVGDYVKSSYLFRAQLKLESYLHQHGYPFAKVHQPEGVVNYEEKTVHVIFPVTLGNPVFMGKVHVEGHENVLESFIANHASWEEGESYNSHKVEAMRHALIDSGIFSGATIKPADEGNGLDPVTMNVHVTEGPPRAIGGGAQYATSQGPGIQGFWRNYNFRGKGEYVGIVARASRVLSEFTLDFHEPDFLFPRTKLKLEAGGVVEDNRAYHSKIIKTGGHFERPLALTTTGSIGVLYELAHLKRRHETNNSSLISMPLSLIIDARDSILNPTDGYKLDLFMTPYYGKMGERLIGTKNELLLNMQARGSFYLPIQRSTRTDEAEIVLASWARVGYSLVRKFEIIPFHKRFYAGGTGSVRAYGFQLLGPLDRRRKPIGGCCLAEGGVEVRKRIMKRIEAVVFLEGGAVTRGKTFNFKARDILYGGGFGVRYFSAIGPIRVDIAFPLKRRKVSGKQVDGIAQLLVSVGQAF